MMQPNNVFLFESSRLNTPAHFVLIDAYPEDVAELKNSVHWHNYFEFEIMADGQSTHFLNGKSTVISRGDAHLLRYSDFHTQQPIAGKRVHLYNFNFDEYALPPEITAALLNSREPFSCKFSESELQEIIRDINILQSESNNTDTSLRSALLTTTFTKIILTFLCKCEENQPALTNNHVASSFNNAISIIHCRFRENLTLIQLANMVGLTPNYLGQQFKSQLGQNYSDYLKTVRLKHAKNLLKHSELTIAAISEYSGFQSVSYFIKCFRSVYNITPKQYITKESNKE